MRTNRKCGAGARRISGLLRVRPLLPHDLHADLNLARQDVLRRHQRREDGAKVGVAGVLLDLIATEIIVVKEVERLRAKLRTQTLRDLGGLEYGCVQLERVVPADLTGAVAGVAWRISGTRSTHTA